MKKLIYLGLLICGLVIPVISASCSVSHNPEKKKYPYRYQTGLTINGNLSDWASTSFCYNNDAHVMYVVANDTSNIYFYIRMPEMSQQISLLTNGFTLVFDPSGKKRETCVIRFQFGRPDKDSIIEKPPTISGMMTCNGFKDDFNGTFPFGGNGNGFMAAVAKDSSETLILEGKAPLQAFPIDPLKPPQVFTMGFTVVSTGGFGEPPHGNRLEGTPQGSRPGRGEMGGGKPGGPPPGNDVSTQPQKVRIWYKFSLAPIP